VDILLERRQPAAETDTQMPRVRQQIAVALLDQEARMVHEHQAGFLL
jgi:hypothetical protein